MKSSTNEPRSRRALLAGAAAGVAAVAVGRPQAASATSGQQLVLGIINESADVTRIYSPSFSGYTSYVRFNGISAAVEAGTSNDDCSGVSAYASGANGIGVRGQTDGYSTTIGVSGVSDPEGIAVKGFTKNGVGVWAEATGGHALRVAGRAVFSRSGRITFNAGQAAKAIANQYVGAGALVLATIQGDVADTWVRGVSLDIPHNRFTIRLNRTAPKALVVGWFIVN